MSDSLNLEEKILLVAVSTGDRRAFNQLYSCYIDKVYDYIYLFTKSKQETEELLQEVFVNIWENREKLAEVESFRSYLFRSAKNRLITNLRHMQVRYKVLSEIKRNKTKSQNTTEDDVAYKEYDGILKKSIEMLPPKRKQIFLMNIEAGLSHDEIAERLQISKFTVKNQLYKAYDTVRQYLAQHGIDSLSILLLILVAIPQRM